MQAKAIKPKPPRRAQKVDSIPLNDEENTRFLHFINKLNYDATLRKFLEDTRLYLRGRCDGPKRSGTDPCCYVFLSRQSFERWHRPILFIDPMPLNTPIKVSFRRWKGILPFDEDIWNDLKNDRMQANMKCIEIIGDADLQRAVDLAVKAKNEFIKGFDTSDNLVGK